MQNQFSTVAKKTQMGPLYKWVVVGYTKDKKFCINKGIDMYQINFEHYGEIVALPKAVAKLMSTDCNEIQIKVFLHLLTCPQPSQTPKELADVLPYSIVKLDEALSFWADKGYLKKSCAPTHDQVVPTPQKKAIVAEQIQLTRGEVTDLLATDETLKYLLYEVENIKGQALSPTECAAFASIYRLQGMPVEELLLLIRYCDGIGRNNLKYIKKVACEWLDAGIDTMEKADAHIQKMQQQKQLGGQYKKVCGIVDRDITKMENDYLFCWVHEFGFDMDMVQKAFEVCVEYTGKLSAKYMNSVLTTWHANGIKTPNEADLQKSKFAPKKKSGLQKGQIQNNSFVAPDTTSRFGRRILTTEK